MAYDITDPAAVHRLQLEGREKLTVAGVEDVERFDDQCIVLRTGAGTLVVSGEGLHIGKLSLAHRRPDLRGRAGGAGRLLLQPPVRLRWAPLSPRSCGAI